MKKTRLTLTILTLAMFALVATAQAGQMKMVPKISSFDLFVDHSGSMMMTHEGMGKKKSELARELLLKINDKVPALPYDASVHTFAPYTERKAQGAYSKGAMADAIKGITTDEAIRSRPTPMGEGIDALRPAVGPMKREGAVIIFSDGVSNIGPEPVAQARALYAAEPGICLHVVSLADKAEGKQTLQEIAKLNDCSVYAEGTDLLADNMKLDAFMQDVFYDMVEEAEPVEEVAVVVEETVVEETVMEEEVIVLRNVNFEFDSANITDESAAILSEAALLVEDRTGIIVLTGHTDSTGPAEYNKILSIKRAGAVRDYFVSQGLKAHRFKVRGEGEAMPEYDNKTKEGRKLNRRVEITFE